MRTNPSLKQEQAVGSRGALAAHAGRQMAQTARPAAPAQSRSTSQTKSAEMVAWREEVQIRTEVTRVPAKFKVKTYITEEKVAKQIPVEYQEATVTKQRIGPEEAARLTPREIKEMTQDFVIELEVVEAVVTKTLVPAERIRVDVQTRKEMVDVEETVRTEHFQIEEPPKGRAGARVRREGYTNLRK